MKKTVSSLALTALVSGFALLPGMAHAYGAAGVVSAPILELPMGVRGEGMGEAFTGIADDVNSVYYNPAGLTALDSVQLELMNIQSFGGVQYENIGLATPTDMLGVNVWSTFALSYTLVNVDDTPLTLEDPSGAFLQTPYSFTAGYSVLTLSYAWQATQAFSVGMTVKAINQKVYTSEGWGVAADLGVMTRQFDGLSAGADLENVGTSPEPNTTLPTELRMGLGYDWENPFTGEQNADKMLFDADLIMPVVPVDQEWELNVGGEYTHDFGKQYGVLRAGYEFPQTVLGAQSSFSVGGGIGTHISGMDLSLDYSWTPYGELGDQQRIALTGTFGAKLRTPAAPKGNYLYPPDNVVAQAGPRSARISWDPQKGKVDGYDIYMSYSPNAKEWTRLNKAPITSTSMTVKNLYAGYKVYFCVSTLAHKSGEVYRESDKSKVVVVTPY
ncbi:MAG TPA: PorV/PorQ family protein [bacterium]|jgi:hypothetical protein|nr:PorV/PorQ family protein [bacterium]